MSGEHITEKKPFCRFVMNKSKSVSIMNRLQSDVKSVREVK